MPNPKATSDDIGTINILFVGTMLFVVRSEPSDGVQSDQIEVLIPNVKRLVPDSKHGYRFLAPGPKGKDEFHMLQPGTRLILEGVSSPSGKNRAQFEPTENICYQGQLASGYRDFLQCSWVLPTPAPQKITSLRVINNVDGDWFINPKDPAVKRVAENHRLAMVHMLTYNYKDLGDVQVRNSLGTVFWKPAIDANSPKNPVLNLRVFAEPQEWPSRTPVPFDAVVGLFTAADNQMPFIEKQVAFENDSEIPGLPTDVKPFVDLPELLHPNGHYARPINCSPAVLYVSPASPA